MAFVHGTDFAHLLNTYGARPTIRIDRKPDIEIIPDDEFLNDDGELRPDCEPDKLIDLIDASEKWFYRHPYGNNLWVMFVDLGGIVLWCDESDGGATWRN